MILKLRDKHILWIASVWWGAFLILSFFKFNFFQIQNIVGVSALLILPGFLTLVLLRVNNLDWWAEMLLIVAVSILELMTLGLLSNTLLPHLHIARPLDTLPLMWFLSFGIFLLLVAIYIRVKEIDITVKKFLIFDTLSDLMIAVTPAIFTILAVLGAISINNGGSNLWTLFMLLGIGFYSVFLIYKAERVGPNVLPVAIFFISLSLLFMTSLRGWYITGHDIQREFRVFELSKEGGLWAIANYKDAYNACMSITILPTIFANLLKINDPYIYKILYQILFAMVPGAVFLIAKRYVNARVAFISTLYFIAFPTFFTDMAFLNRQEVAFIFLVAMIYTIWSESISLRIRQNLFILLGIGMVLSHYSTTYIVIALLGFLVAARPFYLWFAGKIKNRKLFADSGVAALQGEHHSVRSITFGMVIILAAASFFWSSVLTDTSSNSVYRVVLQTISVIQDNAKEDARSSDVLYSLFSFRGSDPKEDFENYKKNIVAPARKKEPNAFYPNTAYSDSSIELAPETLLPLTPAGRWLENEGVDVPQFNFIFRQTSAKLLQIFILIGCAAVIFSRRFTTRSIPDEFILIAVGSILLILSQVLLPVLSVEYGLLRAFQQSLIFLGIFVVIGSEVIFSWSKRMSAIAGIIAVTFLLSATGVFTEFLGGYPPQLHLENQGVYYDIFYVHRSEGVGISWLVSRTEKNDGYTLQSATQSDRYSSTKIPILKNAEVLTDIYPGLIRKNAYVFLGYTNIRDGHVALSYQGDTLTYQYPLQFLDDNKDLLYANQGVKIYR